MSQVHSHHNVVWSSVEGRTRTVTLRRAPARRVAISSHARTTTHELALLGLIVAVLQILDGVLTGIGISQFGTHMEGNAFLRTLMHHIGYVPALVLVKTVAIGVVAGLCVHGARVTWLKPALRGVIGLYVLVAVVPWIFVLTNHFIS